MYSPRVGVRFTVLLGQPVLLSIISTTWLVTSHFNLESERPLFDSQFST